MSIRLPSGLIVRQYSPGNCPKCLRPEPRSRWCKGAEVCVEVLWTAPAIAANHMHRYCDACNYRWYEYPKDIDPEEIVVLSPDDVDKVLRGYDANGDFHDLPAAEETLGERDPEEPLGDE